MEILSGLVFLGICLMIGMAIYHAIRGVLILREVLNDYIFHSDGNILLRIVAIVPWIPLTLFSIAFAILTLISGFYILNEARDWWHKR